MKHISIIRSLVFILFVFTFSCNSEQDNFSERSKIALRDAGNTLLLTNKDSTSLILPIKELNSNKYQLAFNKTLAFEPSTLVKAIEESFVKSKLPEYYIVEVIKCDDEEVAYSYQMSAILESTIIPCAGRYLPNGCYYIEVYFTERVAPSLSKNFILGLVFAMCLAILGILWFIKKNKKTINIESSKYEALGIFKFYPEQNKLVKQAEEIALSKKECELLELFVARPNEIIKRDELTKRVWEDNGVFVGRSLDTYISKLRKKLMADTSIKLTNIHGIGYKLEVS